MRGLLRHRGSHAAVSNLELFFDLVYVFAITQISTFVRAHLDWAGLAEAGVLFLAMWWAWIYTAWATNWANPEAVRQFLKARGILVRQMTAYGLPDCLRITIGRSDELREVVDALSAYPR